jgi:hypothetical protein
MIVLMVKLDFNCIYIFVGHRWQYYFNYAISSIRNKVTHFMHCQSCSCCTSALSSLRCRWKELIGDQYNFNYLFSVKVTAVTVAATIMTFITTTTMTELHYLTWVQSHPWKYTYESHSLHRDGVLSFRKVCVSAALDMQCLCPEL